MGRVFPLMTVALSTLACFGSLQTSHSQAALTSSSQQIQNQVREVAPEACPVTKPPAHPFVPPPPYWTNHGPNQFWYGTESLWTLLGVQGVWPVDNNGRSGNMLTYWQRGFDWHKELEPKLVITARRLDHDAPAVVVAHANAVFVRGPAPAAMMTGIHLPTAGCWEIEAKYKDQKLSFVILAQP